MAYSMSLTYMLWFFFGWLGVHHLYLGRLNHAIVWYATLGGGCGLGWLRDLWRIPAYVRWANADEEYRRRHVMRKELRQYPSCSFFKTLGFFVMGNLAAEVFSGIIPKLSMDDWWNNPLYYIILRLTSKILYCIGAVLGVYLVANIGKTSCKLKKPLMGCLFSLPLVIMSGGNVDWALLLAGFYARLRGLKWREPHPVTNNERDANYKYIYDFALYYLATVTWKSLLYILVYLNASIAVQENQIHHMSLNGDMTQILCFNLMPGVNFCLRDFSRDDSLLAKGTLIKSVGFIHLENTLLSFFLPNNYSIQVFEIMYSNDGNRITNLKLGTN